MSIQQRVLLIFFLQPLALGAWLPRIPEIQDKLGLDNAGLAIALLGAPIGMLVTLLIAGQLATRIGARKIIIGFFPIFLLAMLLPLIAPTLALIVPALMLMGSALSMLEIGLNITADQVEKQGSKLIMSKAHGFWSLGLMAGSLLGSGAAALHISPFSTGLVIGSAVLPIALLTARKLPIDAPQQSPSEKQNTVFSWPHHVLFGICFFTLGTTLAEGAIADWAAVFLRDIFATGPGVAGLGVTLFALFVALSRLIGDRLKLVFGAVPLARTLALTGLLGVCLIYFAPGVLVAIFGFSLIGIGVSLGFPLAVTAAAAAPGPSPARNVAVLSFIALIGFLIGPVAIGLIAQSYDIRIGLLFLLPMLGLSALLSPFLKPGSR